MMVAEQVNDDWNSISYTTTTTTSFPYINKNVISIVIMTRIHHHHHLRNVKHNITTLRTCQCSYALHLHTT